MVNNFTEASPEGNPESAPDYYTNAKHSHRLTSRFLIISIKGIDLPRLTCILPINLIPSSPLEVE